MELIIENGQHSLDSHGIPKSVQGFDALINRAIIRLAIKKGSLPYDKGFGSLFYSIKGGDKISINALALSYARESIDTLATVRGTVCQL